MTSIVEELAPVITSYIERLANSYLENMPDLTKVQREVVKSLAALQIEVFLNEALQTDNPVDELKAHVELVLDGDFSLLAHKTLTEFGSLQ